MGRPTLGDTPVRQRGVRLDDETWERITVAAQRRHITINAWLREQLVMVLDGSYVADEAAVRRQIESEIQARLEPAWGAPVGDGHLVVDDLEGVS